MLVKGLGKARAAGFAATEVRAERTPMHETCVVRSLRRPPAVNSTRSSPKEAARLSASSSERLGSGANDVHAYQKSACVSKVLADVDATWARMSKSREGVSQTTVARVHPGPRPSKTTDLQRGMHDS